MSPHERDVMGLPVAIDAPDAPGAAVEAAFAWLRWVDATFSTYRADSEIRRLDRGELRLHDCAPEVDAVLTACLDLQRRTDGYFSARAGGRLDPSGYVKGWAVAEAARRLRAAGVADGCVNAGGDVVAWGRPRRVGVRHPLEPGALAAVLEVDDAAVATSAEYERGTHILDPHTGRPPAGLLSVTVVGPDLALADAYATAAFAMGTAGPAWVAGLDGYAALCVTTGHEVLTTPGLDAYRVS